LTYDDVLDMFFAASDESFVTYRRTAVTLRILVEIVPRDGDTRVRELARAELADLSTLDGHPPLRIVASEERNQVTGRPACERHDRRAPPRADRLASRRARGDVGRRSGRGRVVIKTATDVARIARGSPAMLRPFAPASDRPPFASRRAGARHSGDSRSIPVVARLWLAAAIEPTRITDDMSPPARWFLSIRNSAGPARSRVYSLARRAPFRLVIGKVGGRLIGYPGKEDIEARLRGLVSS
jgi:hypothetical protein